MTNGDGQWHNFNDGHGISNPVLATIREMAAQSTTSAKKLFASQDNEYQRLLAILGRKDKEKTSESEHKSVERS